MGHSFGVFLNLCSPLLCLREGHIRQNQDCERFGLALQTQHTAIPRAPVRIEGFPSSLINE